MSSVIERIMKPPIKEGAGRSQGKDKSGKEGWKKWTTISVPPDIQKLVNECRVLLVTKEQRFTSKTEVVKVALETFRNHLLNARRG